ncbi:MAG: LysE family translocator [Alphaproteobacteria bacterium]|nr:LysE family translocator [Alphaproteobacteria bacterium]
MMSLLQIPIETLTVFAAASIALAFAPGPDNIFVLTQSALHGRLAGLFVTIGLATGLLVHTIAVAFGVAAIFATSALAFTALKIVGAAYLLYLAWQAFRAGTTSIPEEGGAGIHSGKLYARGVIMNITNPKVAIFFLAFLPQFADPSRGSLTVQLIAFGAVFIVVTLLVFGSIAWFSGLLGEKLRASSRAQLILNRMAGLVFTGLALRLAIAER